jgi:hypothetical protein
MKLVTVKSSNIAQVGYDEAVGISLNQEPMSVLRVVFANGLVYDYYRVPKEVYEELLEADSAGIYFHKNIKKRYVFEKR